MNSSIYEGIVVHARREPQHRFQYRLFMMYMDLDELSDVFAKRLLWSTHFPNLAWFRRQDYLGGGNLDLAESVRDLVADRTGRRPDGAIRLLTNLRYFGFIINPISLYYCFNKKEEVEFVVADVTNTPWGERHAYVLDFNDADLPAKQRSDKQLHVSPFMSMDYAYRFELSKPLDRLAVRIENHQHGNSDCTPSFFATLSLNRVPINSWNLAWSLIRYPLMTMQIVLAIYWQAFRLHLKGAKFFAHPGKRNTPEITPSKSGINDSEVCLEEMESTIS